MVGAVLVSLALSSPAVAAELELFRLTPPPAAVAAETPRIAVLPAGFVLEGCRIKHREPGPFDDDLRQAAVEALAWTWPTPTHPATVVPPSGTRNPFTLVPTDELMVAAAAAGHPLQPGVQIKLRELAGKLPVDGVLDLRAKSVRSSDKVRVEVEGRICGTDSSSTLWRDEVEVSKSVSTVLQVNGSTPAASYVGPEARALNQAFAQLMTRIVPVWDALTLEVPTGRCTRKAMAALERDGAAKARTQLQADRTKGGAKCKPELVAVAEAVVQLVEGDLQGATASLARAQDLGAETAALTSARVVAATLQNEARQLQALAGVSLTPAAATASVPAPPQAPAPPQLPSLDQPLKTGERATRDAALIVGIEQYFVAAPVPHAVHDAAVTYDLIVHTIGVPRDRVELLTANVNKEAMLAAWARTLDAVEPGGVLWFYFAGHGAASPSTGERLLLGDDVRRDAAQFEARAVGLDHLADQAAARGVTLMLWTDACYNGLGRGGEALSQGTRSVVPDHAPALQPGLGLWTAAGPDQLSGPLPGVAHGAFTYFAVGALRGWADGELDGQRDGQVTAAEAQAYVLRALREHQIHGQQPVLSLTEPASWVLTRGVGESAP